MWLNLWVGKQPFKVLHGSAQKWFHTCKYPARKQRVAVRHPGNLAGVGSSHWCVCAACKALPLLPRAPTVPWRERFPEAALCLTPSGSLTHPANAPELPGEDQPSPAVLVPRGEATKERTGVWDRGNGDTELPLPDAPGARGKLPRKLHSYLNLSKDQTARGEGSSQ